MKINKILHEPTRFEIMRLLSDAEYADFIFLQKELELTQGNLSSHLSKLESKKYILSKKDIVNKKTHTRYSLTEKGKNELFQYVQLLSKKLNEINLN